MRTSNRLVTDTGRIAQLGITDNRTFTTQIANWRVETATGLGIYESINLDTGSAEHSLAERYEG